MTATRPRQSSYAYFEGGVSGIEKAAMVAEHVQTAEALLEASELAIEQQARLKQLTTDPFAAAAGIDSVIERAREVADSQRNESHIDAAHEHA